MTWRTLLLLVIIVHSTLVCGIRLNLFSALKSHFSTLGFYGDKFAGPLSLSSKKKVLILLSDTGGGHRASAQALNDAICTLYPNKFDVEILDIWTKYAKWPFNKLPNIYVSLERHPQVWSGLYHTGKISVAMRAVELWSSYLNYESFKDAIETKSPDVIISVHPLCQNIPLSIVDECNKKRSKKIPFLTVVTDLATAHPTWFDKRATKVYVPSRDVYNTALQQGIKTENICLTGLPVRSKFWKNIPSKSDARLELGLHQSLRTVLVMSGGDGIGKMEAVAREVSKALASFQDRSQLVIVCGHNKRAQISLRRAQWPWNVNVQVKGFVDCIDRYMAASDCLVSKAGPGTIAEAMICGLPMVLSSYIPGQESGNVPFVVNGGFGVFPGTNPRRIGHTVQSLFRSSSGDILTSMSRAARALSSPNATLEIAGDIGSMAL